MTKIDDVRKQYAAQRELALRLYERMRGQDLLVIQLSADGTVSMFGGPGRIHVLVLTEYDSIAHEPRADHELFHENGKKFVPSVDAYMNVPTASLLDRVLAAMWPEPDQVTDDALGAFARAYGLA